MNILTKNTTLINFFVNKNKTQPQLSLSEMKLNYNTIHIIF